MSGAVINIDRLRAVAADPDELPPEAFGDDGGAAPPPVRRFARGDHAELADALIGTLSPDPRRVVSDDGSIHVYADETGIWSPVTIDALRRVVKSFAGSPRGARGTLSVSSSAVDGAIKLALSDVESTGFFSESPNGIAFEDCFVSVNGGKLRVLPNSHANRCRRRHAFAYNAGADRAPLEAFLDDVFSDCEPCETQARKWLLQEFAGACLVGIAPTYQKCLVLLGSGGNGKSQALRIVRGALPDGTIASLPPQLWAERFQVARLIGVTANLCDELPEREFIESGTFKSIVTGEPTHIERKYFDPFDAVIRCGHAFSANALPGTADLSDAFFRRFAVLPFSRRFDGTAECKADVGASVVQACRPGIVAWALEGAARLQQQGGYTIPASSIEAVARWRQEADSVASFIADGYERLPVDAHVGDGTKASQLYSDYRAWAERGGFRPVNANTFGRRMGAIGLPSIHVASGRYHLVRARMTGWGAS